MRSLPLFLLVILTLAAPAVAQNVDLATVPDRDAVQLTIYNSEDITLVRETRTVSFKRGMNTMQFSWANTLIDPSSVEVRFLDHADQLTVLDTTYPHDRPQVLYWNIASELDGEAQVQITYFTSGITWSADYVGIADAAETAMRLEGFVRVHNNSGEDYENAQVRLVVGTINLVEKIARLARVPMSEVGKLKDDQRDMYRQRAQREVLESVMEDGSLGAAAPSAAPKEIIKEGLSEYFIYTIEGTETVPHGWSKRLRSFDAHDARFEIKYRYRPQEYGDKLVRMYVLRNDEQANLGTTPLPDGIVRVFRDTGRGSLSFLAAQQVRYIPIGDKIELNLGEDPEVVFELVKLAAARENIWMHLRGGNVFRRVHDGDVRIDVNSTVAGWDEREHYVQRIRNYTAKPIDVEVRRAYPGHVVFRSLLEPTLHDYRTVQFQTVVQPGEKQALHFEVIRSHGHNAKQNNVTLENGRVQ